MKISVFGEAYVKPNGDIAPQTKPYANIDFSEYIHFIKFGKWEDEVLNVRSGRWPKAKSPYITPSGIFEYRNIKGLLAHSGIIAIDIDAKDNSDIDIDEMSADPYIYALHQSISGNGGWVAYIKIEPDRHLDAFLALEKYFANKYSVIIDPSCKDISRARFVSHDPNAVIMEKSKVFKSYIPQKKQEVKKTYVFTESDLEYIFLQIKDREINICEDYHEWVKVGMAFANTYGEAGRNKFHFISQFSGKYTYEKAEKEYDGFLKRRRNENSLGSFFWLCQQHGIKIKTTKTETIERIAKMRRKSSNGQIKNPKEDAIKTLELSGISKEEAEPIVDQVMMMPQNEIQNEKTDDLIQDLKAFLMTYKMEFNEITRKIEIDGNEVDDRILNTVYIKSKEVVSDKINKDLLFSIIDSEFTQTYNPFQRFFNKNKHLKPIGLIEELFSCIEYEAQKDDMYVNNYLHTYLQKWLLSVIASMHGVHSEMILVFIGGQGERKTKFFRSLLPDDLTAYYAESKLDGGTDDHMLMCKKIIILDDEFGGKSKQEAKKLKDLSSKSVFTIRKPYGKFHEDLKRIAVLAGTSNEHEIINDPTGNRRIIPVNIVKIDWERYQQIDKTALWMELYWKYKEIGDNWMLTKTEIEWLNDITRGNESPSIEAEAIEMFFYPANSTGPKMYLTNTEILNYIESRTRLKISPTKLGLNMKKLGYEKITKKFDGKVKLVYEVVAKGTTYENINH